MPLEAHHSLVGLEVLWSSKVGVNPIGKWVFNQKSNKREIYQWQNKNIQEHLQTDRGN